MRRQKRTTLPLGTISAGTLRLEDLIPALIGELAPLRLTKSERAALRQVQRAIDHEDAYFDSENASEDYEELTAIAHAHVPEYAYFGSLEGDGAEIGVWPLMESIDEDVQKVADLPIANHYAPPVVAQVSDHGNVTLYRRAGKRWIEVWSVV